MGKASHRGATMNTTSSPFRLPQREADGDRLDVQQWVDGAPPPPRVTVLKPRTILTRNASPDMPFAQSINAFGGCDRSYTVARQSEAASALSNADDFFDQNRASAIPKVSLRSLLSTYATVEPDTEVVPHRFSLFPVGYSPSLRVKLLAAFPKTFDGGSILDSDRPAIFRTAAIEPAVLEIGEPIANQELPLTISHVHISNAGSSLRSSGCNDEREDRRHVDSLPEPSSGAMVFAW